MDAVQYDKVVVFRRNPDGTCAIHAPALVLNRIDYPGARTFYVPNFDGTQKEAIEHAYAVARKLAAP